MTKELLVYKFTTKFYSTTKILYYELLPCKL